MSDNELQIINETITSIMFTYYINDLCIVVLNDEICYVLDFVNKKSLMVNKTFIKNIKFCKKIYFYGDKLLYEHNHIEYIDSCGTGCIPDDFDYTKNKF